MEGTSNDSVADVLRLLYDEGLDVTPIVSTILEKEICRGKEKSWLKLKGAGEFTDDHLVYGALSEMSFPTGTFVAPSFITQKLKDIERAEVDAHRWRIDDWRKHETERIYVTAQALRSTFEGHTEVRYCVPVCTEYHWGLCIAEYSTKQGRVRWGDSMGKEDYFIGIARTLARVMDFIFFPKDAILVRNNYMIDEMRFVQQSDGHSCGFYVVATIASLATSLGCLEGYGFYERCCDVVGETLRGQALKCYFARVMEAFEIFRSEKPALNTSELVKEFTEFHVYRHINRNRLGHVFPQAIMNPLPTTPCVSDGIEIWNPSTYITELNCGGARFRMDEHENLINVQKNLSGKVASYSCQRNIGTCPAKFYFNFMKDGRIFAIRRGLHNHCP